MHCRIWCSALVVMAVAVWSWDASCMHCEGYCSTESNSSTLVVMAVAVWSWDASCMHCEGYCSTQSNSIMMPETC